MAIEPAAPVAVGGAETLPPVLAAGGMDVLQGGTVHELVPGEPFDAFEHATTATKLMVL